MFASSTEIPAPTLATGTMQFVDEVCIHCLSSSTSLCRYTCLLEHLCRHGPPHCGPRHSSEQRTSEKVFQLSNWVRNCFSCVLMVNPRGALAQSSHRVKNATALAHAHSKSGPRCRSGVPLEAVDMQQLLTTACASFPWHIHTARQLCVHSSSRVVSQRITCFHQRRPYA